MNLGEISNLIYDRIGAASTPDSATVRRVNRNINNVHREILGKRGFGRMRKRVLTCSSIANDPFMCMPQSLTNIINIGDRTNNRNLDVLSMADVRYIDPGLRSLSIPYGYAIFNFASCVALQPSAAASLFVISDSANDGSGLAVNIEGIVTGGLYRRASIAMNGLTAVNVASTITTWEQVLKFYVSGQAAGNITLRQTSGVGTELGHIAPGRSYPRYTIVHLSPTPSTAQTYYVDAEVHVEDMVNVNDEPLIPEDFHWLLETGVMKREYLKKEKPALYKIEALNWQVGLADLRADLAKKGAVGNNGQRNQSGSGFSQLGGDYPAGS
jgi:hypothetical protein